MSWLNRAGGSKWGEWCRACSRSGVLSRGPRIRGDDGGGLLAGFAVGADFGDGFLEFVQVFEILVDGEVVATVDLNKYKESKFYDIEYRLPLSATAGKKTVRVTFKAKPGNQAGPVYGVRIVKESRVN